MIFYLGKLWKDEFFSGIDLYGFAPIPHSCRELWPCALNMLCVCRCLSAWIVSKWGWLSLTATGDGFNTRARHQASSGEEQSRISAESGEMLTTAALLLSENSALSTALMCHMMLQSEKYHCPSSNWRADCMCSMVSPSVWVLCYNTRVFWLFFLTLCLGCQSPHFSGSHSSSLCCDSWGEE